MTNFGMIARSFVGIAALAGTASAQAGFLYWSKAPMRMAGLNGCLSAARTAAANRQLTNIRFTPGLEVAGAQGTAYAAMTCVAGAGGQPATGIVMVMGDNQQQVMGLRDALIAQMKTITIID